MAFAHGIPLVGVHHIAGHIYANRLVKEDTISFTIACCIRWTYGASLYERTWSF